MKNAIVHRKILFFGRLTTIGEYVDISHDDGITAQELKQLIISKFSSDFAANLFNGVRLATNTMILDDQAAIFGDEDISMLPPVGGG